jgi:hypothetical protein
VEIALTFDSKTTNSKLMNENELQLIVLQIYYDHRKETKVILSPDDFGGMISQNEIGRISKYLSEKGLLEWTPLEWNSGIGRITAFGIDLGSVQPPA